MLDITEWAWVFDKTFVVCRKVDNKVVVEMEMIGNTRVGEIQDFPIAIFGRIVELNGGEKMIEKLVKTAADEFFRVYLGET